jgi:exodeoxyribonuclease V beta subunit
MNGRLLDWKKLELEGSHLIEASAGTGKTYTIGLIVLRMVLEDAIECPMARIALITFTKPAARELAERMEGFLEEALSIQTSRRQEPAGDPVGAIDPVRAAIAAANARHGGAEVRRRLENARRDLDQARICTINSFCAGLLDEFAFELGASAGWETLADESELIEAILADFWRREVVVRPLDEQALVDHLTPSTITAKLDVLLKFPEAPVHGPKLAERPGLWTELAAAWTAERGAFVEFCASPSVNRRSVNAKWLPTWLPRIDEALSLHSPDPDDSLDGDGSTVKAAIDRLSRRWWEGGKALAEGASLPQLAVFDRADDWCERPGQLEAALLTRAAAYLKSELAARKAKLRQRSFGDQIVHLAHGLDSGGDSAARAIRGRFRAVLVDEFQDTDHLQYHIFRRLFQDRPGIFFAMIGDPKQAIYRFRGGDINAYLEAAASVAEERRHTLAVNYRSQRRLIDALNRIYGSHTDPFKNPGIGYVRIESGTAFGPATRGGHVMPPVTLWEAADNAAVDTVLVGQRLAVEILRLCDSEKPAEVWDKREKCQRRVRLSDMAVLVGSHATALELRRSLAAAGIRSVLAKSGSVLASPEADELELLFDCLVNLGDESRLRALLASPLYGGDLAWLEAWSADDLRRLETVDSLAVFLSTWQHRGLGLALDRFLLERGQFASGGADNGQAAIERDRRITNFRHLMELLHREDERLGRLPARTLHRFREMRQEPGGEEHEQRLESDAEAVQIITMHKSKGLQWPVVFAVELAKDGLGGNKREPTPLLRQADGRPLVSFDPADAAAIEATDRRELIEERQRLAYVALTRPESLLYAVCGGKNQDSPAAWLLTPEHTGGHFEESGLDGLSLPLVVREPLADIPDAGSVAAPPETARDHRRLGRLSGNVDLRPRWTIGSYSGLTRDIRHVGAPHPAPAGVPPATSAPAAAPAGIFAFPRGAEAGTALHEVLEKVDFQDPAGWPRRVGKLLAAAGHGAPAQVEAACAMVAAIMEAPLLPDDPEFRLSRLDRSDKAAELEFWLSAAHPAATGTHGTPPPPLTQERLAAVLPPDMGRIGPKAQLAGYLNGTIDLVFTWKSKWYILDWKSNHLGNTAADYGPERLAAEMSAANYHLQYLFYAIALGRHLAKILPGSFDRRRDFGGVLYLFIRGVDGSLDGQGRLNGVFFTRPDQNLISDLEALIP